MKNKTQAPFSSLHLEAPKHLVRLENTNRFFHLKSSKSAPVNLDNEIARIFEKALARDILNSNSNSFELFKDGKRIKTSQKKKALLKKQLIKSPFSVEGWKDSPYSVRISKLEELNAEFAQLIKKMNVHFDWRYFFSVNLYYTPGKLRNCLDFHSDPHHTLVYQMSGAKKWSFPKNKKEHLFSYNPEMALPYFNTRNSYKTTIKPGDWLGFPSGAIHKAEIVSDQPSLHFTFACCTTRNHQGVYNIISEKLFEQLDLLKTKYKIISTKDFFRFVTDVKKSIDPIILEREYLKKNWKSFTR